MNTAAAAVVGAVAGWIGGIVLIMIVRWLSMAVLDQEIVLRGLEFVGAAAGVAIAIVLGRRNRRADRTDQTDR